MREVTRAQKARLGLFLIISGSVLLGLLIAVTGTRMFEKRDEYTVRYRDLSVSGLEIGAQVKYHGVRVGRVDKIFIDPNEVETVVITLSLNGGTPVKKDVEAEITAMSLTGLKIIELTGGSTQAEVLPPGSEIPAGESMIQSITGKAEAVSEKLELVLTNLANLTGGENQQRLLSMIDNTTLVLGDFHDMLQDNRQPVTNTIKNLEIASANIREITESPELQSILVNLDTVSGNLKAVDFALTVQNLNAALKEAQATFNHIDLTVKSGRRDLLISLEVLRESLDSFNEFSRQISEDPSLLLRGSKGNENRLEGGR